MVFLEGPAAGAAGNIQGQVKTTWIGCAQLECIYLVTRNLVCLHTVLQRTSLDFRVRNNSWQTLTPAI